MLINIKTRQTKQIKLQTRISLPTQNKKTLKNIKTDLKNIFKSYNITKKFILGKQGWFNIHKLMLPTILTNK